MDLTAVATIAVALTVGLTWAAPAAAAVDRDCDDFSNQAAAQEYFLSIGGPDSDPDRLDQEGNGVACQSLPCPCIGAPNSDLWISVIFFAVLLIGSAAYWRQRRSGRLEESVFIGVGVLLVLSTLCALLAVVNFALAEPLVEDIVPFLLGILIPALAVGIASLLAYTRERNGA